MKSLEKFIKRRWFTLLIVIIFLFAAIAIILVKVQQRYNANPGLIWPKKNYNIQVELTPEQEMEYETNIIEADKKIQEAIASGEQKIELESGVTSTIASIPNITLFIDKATNLELLGKYNEAIETMNGAFRKWYDKDVYGWNYLAFLYRQVKEYDIALKIYERILEEYPEYNLDILLKITQIYIQLGDKETAGKYYIQYELSGGVRDENLMQGIRQLQ